MVFLGSCTVSAPALAREYEDGEERIYTARTDAGGVTVEAQASYTRRVPAGAGGTASGSGGADSSGTGGGTGADSGYSGAGLEGGAATASGSGTGVVTGPYGLPWSRRALIAAVRDTSLPGHVRGAAGILSWILANGTPPADPQTGGAPTAAQLETVIHTESIRIAAANAEAWMEPARGWVAINYPVRLHYSAPAQRHTVTLLGAEVVIDLVPVRATWEVPGAEIASGAGNVPNSANSPTAKAGNVTPGRPAQTIPARQPCTEVIYRQANAEVSATLVVEWEARYSIAGQSRTVPELLTTRSETAPVITRELEAHLIG
ncbi:hypothetical protein [Actinotignum schaalii]|uniref:hypothetical protein n=1 Tax=Actinotignum schaalii TaxID=59505 RepID=UPI000422B4C3|nr:hypothetical protein [Actinotignum schaalii]AIE82823.1 hypothetical protein FB03_05640 [Actinotignum schaalii]WQN44945.1 hypothetical protein U4A90_08125 [Actinotignum schaalii]